MTTSTTATILATHRGYTVTDEAYGSEPFTIYTPEGRVLDHCDEETIEQCCDTIDVIEDERKANAEETFAHWQTQEGINAFKSDPQHHHPSR